MPSAKVRLPLRTALLQGLPRSLRTAGFGYDFQALSLKSDALAQAFASLFSPRDAPGKPHPSQILINSMIGACLHALPVLKLAEYLPDQRLKSIKQALNTLEVESRKIVQAKMEKADQEDALPKKDLLSILRESRALLFDLNRDILTLLPAVSTKAKDTMSPEEVRGQLTVRCQGLTALLARSLTLPMQTFLFAGHETISNSLSWVLWELACHPDKQERLRAEVRAARKAAMQNGRDELTSDELSGLEYLDAVTVCSPSSLPKPPIADSVPPQREILRLEPPLSSTPRVAQKNDVIPLSVPVKSVTDPSQTIDHIVVHKGQSISIGVYAANRDKSIFGDDANDFRPERWLDAEHRIETKVGGWSGLMTFLAGPRACIGYKFALLEFKACVACDLCVSRPRTDVLSTASSRSSSMRSNSTYETPIFRSSTARKSSLDRSLSTRWSSALACLSRLGSQRRTSRTSCRDGMTACKSLHNKVTPQMKRARRPSLVALPFLLLLLRIADRTDCCSCWRFVGCNKPLCPLLLPRGSRLGLLWTAKRQ